jgi:hypothetical protein
MKLLFSVSGRCLILAISEGLTGAAEILTSTCPGSGTGTGTVFTCRLPSAVRHTALISFGIVSLIV